MGVEVAAFPGVQLHDDLVFGLGWGRQVGPGRVADHDLAGDARVVGDDIPGEAGALQRAGQLGERALDHADDDGGAPVLALAVAADGVEFHQHAVAVQRHAGVAGLDVHLLPRFLPRLGVEHDAGRTAGAE